MKTLCLLGGVILICAMFALNSCAAQEQPATTPSSKPAEAKPAPAASKGAASANAEDAKSKTTEAKTETKAAEKAKAEKAAGDVGLLDTEKNYMILVTKEGKLITLDFDQKAKVTMLEPKDVKMNDVGLGSSATVEYVTKGDKKVVTKMEFRAAKGGD